MGEGHRIGSAKIHYFGGFSQELFDVQYPTKRRISY
jgi:hypothetical protein